MTVHRAVVLPLLLAIASPIYAQARPDSVSLRFAWPVGMSARVEHEWSRVQQSAARRDSTLVRSGYRLRVAPHPEGRLIQIDSFQLRQSDGVRKPGGDAGEELLARIGSLLPSSIVSAGGEFRRIANIGTVKAALDSLLAPMRRDLATAPPQLKALLERASSQEALTASAAQEWNILVGTWVGVDWEIGALYEYSAKEPIPYLPGQQVTMNYEFAAAERVACPGEEGRGCVELVMRSQPDSTELATVVRGFLESVAPKERAAIAGLRSMRMLNELTVITNPSTLAPHWVELIRFTEMAVPASRGGPAGTMTRVDRRASRYRYER
ncbi:MAG TPA: hypothetical protein VJ596_00710 [Gemmatimonadaceae bacterium]|nr:hypothetical protein [Gemmatimonadaceae bacterium]